MKGLVILALTLVAVWTATGSTVKDSVVLRVFNKNLKISATKMLAILSKANLKKHGYELEVTNQLTRESAPRKAEFTRTYFYYKIVPCDKAFAVEQELNRLLGGTVLGSGVARKTKKDLKKQKIENPSKTCKAGIEVHVRNQQRCVEMTKDDDPAKRGAPKPCKKRAEWCGICYKCITY